MTHKFQVGDTGKTRDGREYRVICTDAGGKRPIVALVKLSTGEWSSCMFRTDGRNSLVGAMGNDLLPPPPKTRKIVRWVVLLNWGSPALVDYESEADAIECARDKHSLMPDGKPLRIEVEVLDR